MGGLPKEAWVESHSTGDSTGPQSLIRNSEILKRKILTHATRDGEASVVSKSLYETTLSSSSCRNSNACDYGVQSQTPLGMLCNVRCMHSITFLKSEKFWIPEHIWPQEFRIRDCGLVPLCRLEIELVPHSKHVIHYKGKSLSGGVMFLCFNNNTRHVSTLWRERSNFLCWSVVRVSKMKVSCRELEGLQAFGKMWGLKV
jgi:hypothetical protein